MVFHGREIPRNSAHFVRGSRVMELCRTGVEMELITTDWGEERLGSLGITTWIECVRRVTLIFV